MSCCREGARLLRGESKGVPVKALTAQATWVADARLCATVSSAPVAART